MEKMLILILTVSIILAGCVVGSKPESNIRAGICYDRYIEGEQLSVSCEKAVRYGQ